SAEEQTAGPEESNLRLLADSLRPDVRRPLRVARYATGLAAKAFAAVDSVRTNEDNRAILRAPKTPFNGSIVPRRGLECGSIAMDVDGPVERHTTINRATMSAKAMNKAIGARQIQSLGEVAAPLILSRATRAVYRSQLMSRLPMRVNTLVSNVPGPPIPLYMC